MKLHIVLVAIILFASVLVCPGVMAADSSQPVYLYLVQHAERVSADVDPQKPLSKNGIKDIKRVSKKFSKLDPNVDEIRHSHQLRSKQTAEYLARRISSGRVPLREVDNLEWNSDVVPLAKELSKTKSNIILTGHLPHLGKLTSYLLIRNKDKEIIEFHKGGIVCLKRSDGKWLVEWIISPLLSY